MNANNVEQLARQSIEQRVVDARLRSAAAQCRARRDFGRRHRLACKLHVLAEWLDARSPAEARPAR